MRTRRCELKKSDKVRDSNNGEGKKLLEVNDRSP